MALPQKRSYACVSPGQGRRSNGAWTAGEAASYKALLPGGVRSTAALPPSGTVNA